MKKKILLIWILTLCYAVAVNAQNALPIGNHAANINGARIFFNITGQGTPLLLIHGYPLNSDLFVQQRNELSRRFTVITMDLRGFGRSLAPDDQASIDIYANDVIGLLNLLNIPKAVIGGHSLGGIIALDAYRLAPSRFIGMLLIDTVASAPSVVEHFMWKGYGQQAILNGADSFLPNLLPIFLTAESRSGNPELVMEISNLIRTASLNSLVGGATALAERPDYQGLLPAISVPTIFIYGREDPLTSIEVGINMQAAVPGSELFVIDNASHLAIREKSQVIDNIILSWAARRLIN